MFRHGKTVEPKVCPRISLRDKRIEDLQVALEKYDLSYDLDEIVEIIESPFYDKHIRYAAYLYLTANGSIEPVKTLSDHMNFSYSDSQGRNATLIAAQFGRTEVIEWLTKYTSSCLTQTNKLNQDVVLTAIAFDHQTLLNRLVRPTHQGGYGLSLSTADIYGRGPVLTAIVHERLSILSELTTSKTDKGYGLTFSEIDNQGNNCVLTAVAFGLIDTLDALTRPLNQGGFGQSIVAINTHGNDAVLVAISNNQLAVLKRLVASTDSGGFGCSLAIKNHYGSGPVLSAVGTAATEILTLLLNATEDGGFGLSLDEKNNGNHDAIDLAVINDQLTTLETLFNIFEFATLDAAHVDRLFKLAAEELSADVYTWLFMKRFEQKCASETMDDAIAWVTKQFYEESFCEDYLKILIVKKLENDLENIFMQENLDDATFEKVETIVNAIEALSCGKGRFKYAAFCLEKSNYEDAFQHFDAIRRDQGCNTSLRDLASYEIASMIINGYLISTSQNQVTINRDPSKHKIKYENKDPAYLLMMQKRAIWAYQYVINNSLKEAGILQQKLDVILSGNVSGIAPDKETRWTEYAGEHFYNYHCKFNPSIFQNEMIKNSFKFFAAGTTAEASLNKVDHAIRQQEQYRG